MCAGAQAAEHDMLRVGLKYGNEAMDEARLQNYSPFGGYAPVSYTHLTLPTT